MFFMVFPSYKAPICGGFSYDFICSVIFPMVFLCFLQQNLHGKNGDFQNFAGRTGELKITMPFMGKSTISTGPCSIAFSMFTRPGFSEACSNGLHGKSRRCCSSTCESRRRCCASWRPWCKAMGARRLGHPGTGLCHVWWIFRWYSIVFPLISC